MKPLTTHRWSMCLFYWGWFRNIILKVLTIMQLCTYPKFDPRMFNLSLHHYNPVPLQPSLFGFHLQKDSSITYFFIHSSGQRYLTCSRIKKQFVTGKDKKKNNDMSQEILVVILIQITAKLLITTFWRGLLFNKHVSGGERVHPCWCLWAVSPWGSRAMPGSVGSVTCPTCGGTFLCGVPIPETKQRLWSFEEFNIKAVRLGD